ncbi:HNH endonuclease [Clostridium tagluense]|uniref:HNH nuclease domain-containing protein n=1 Tax=Clostridium tagluense TaxID=360422 RepID=A0A401UQF2_9CLOT|nr:HNH endonuclease [Clostridium tagluense]GCD11754.1 hypothetical protein Ctaglu_33770 [Clostridium tagluense]
MIRKRAKQNNIMWAWDKTEFFKMLYSTTSNKDLALLFNTTIGTVEAKAFRLRLLKTKETIIEIHKQGQHKKVSRAKKITAEGFAFIYRPLHPNCDLKGFIKESRLIMEQKLGRYLTKGGIVLHKNRDNTDDRIENLEVADHFRIDILPSDIYNDRKSGMQVQEIRDKYNISINTYYRKLKHGEKDYCHLPKQRIVK